VIFKPAQSVIDAVMSARAGDLSRAVLPLLPNDGNVLDVGSGTGHNATALRQSRPDLRFRECDVVDMHVVGNGADLIIDGRLPYDNSTFAAVTLFFVLQYPDDPLPLLREARRVMADGGHVIAAQTVCRGRLGRCALKLHEQVWGPVAYSVARTLRAVPDVRTACLTPRRWFSESEIKALFKASGLEVRDTVRMSSSPAMYADTVYQLQ